MPCELDCALTVGKVTFGGFARGLALLRAEILRPKPIIFIQLDRIHDLCLPYCFQKAFAPMAPLTHYPPKLFLGQLGLLFEKNCNQLKVEKSSAPLKV